MRFLSTTTNRLSQFKSQFNGIKRQSWFSTRWLFVNISVWWNFDSGEKWFQTTKCNLLAIPSMRLPGVTSLSLPCLLPIFLYNTQLIENNEQEKLSKFTLTAYVIRNVHFIWCSKWVVFVVCMPIVGVCLIFFLHQNLAFNNIILKEPAIKTTFFLSTFSWVYCPSLWFEWHSHTHTHIRAHIAIDFHPNTQSCTQFDEIYQPNKLRLFVGRCQSTRVAI